MGLDRVDQVRDPFSTVAEVGLVGRAGVEPQPLSVPELRRRFDVTNRVGGDASNMTLGECRLVARSLTALRRRVEQFNRRVAPGLRVELNPALSAWASGVTQGEA